MRSGLFFRSSTFEPNYAGLHKLFSVYQETKIGVQIEVTNCHGFQDGIDYSTMVPVGPIAQSVEQRTFNPWVDGSSPSGPTFLLVD